MKKKTAAMVLAALMAFSMTACGNGSTQKEDDSTAADQETTEAVSYTHLEMKESGVLKKTALVFGQMNEPPGSRMRVAETGLTMAEYFRDTEHRDVLLFIDNIFRFVQAGSEVSALLGRCLLYTSRCV